MLKHIASVAAALTLALGGTAYAGPVFLTGHDPDFHAQGQHSGESQLEIALNFVTNGTFDDGFTKFLWVESNNPVLGGHRRGHLGLDDVGVTTANYDVVDGAGFGAVDLTDYSAIVVASTFGGMLTSAEINALIARQMDIAGFVNAGGGLAAFAECGAGFADCDPTNVAVPTTLYGFVPVGAVASSTAPPYTLTAYGVSLGFTTADVNDCCTHNSFASAAGLNVVDFDSNGNPTTLAGIVRIGDGGFMQGVPEPATWALMILGFGTSGVMLRRRRPAMG